MAGGSLIGGIIGAIIGTLIAGPGGAAQGAAWGWAIGSTAGALIEAEMTDGPHGPKLADLTVTASQYGKPIPIVYSVMAVGGNIIWATHLVEEDAGDRFIYKANFAVLICESDGDHALGRIWAGPDRRQIYDPTTRTVESGTVRFYSGRDDQEPDDLMTLWLGAGNVPAYKGYAILVFENFNVSTFDFNRIPDLTIEVGQALTGGTAAGDGPADTGYTWFGRVLQTDDFYFMFYYGSYSGVTIRSKVDDGLYRNWLLPHTTLYHQQTFLDPDRQRIVTPRDFERGFYILNWDSGVETAHDIVTPVGADTIATTGVGTGLAGIIDGVYYNGRYIFLSSSYGNLTTGLVTLWVVNPDTFVCEACYSGQYGGSATPAKIMKPHVDGYGYVYVVMSDNWILRINLASGAAPTLIGTALTHEWDNIAVAPNTGYIWSAVLVGSVLWWIVHNPQTLGAINGGSVASGFSSIPMQPWAFGTGGGGSEPVLLAGTTGPWNDYFAFFLPNGTLSEQVYGNSHAGSGLQAVIFDAENFRFMGFDYGGIVVTSPVSGVGSGLFLSIYSNSVYMFGDAAAFPARFYHADTSVHSIVPEHLRYQNLQEVVTDLCLRAGLTSGDFDVTDLQAQVDGYTIAAQTSIKDAIQKLMPAYYFDAVESQGVLKFVARGASMIVEIPDNDLGAYESGSENPMNLLTTTRIMDEELPETYTVNYLLAATNYQPANQYARRLVGHSGNESSTTFPMVFTDTKGAEVANVILYDQWVSRVSFAFTLPLKYAYLEPTDIIGISGFVMRITKMTQKSGYFECEAVRDTHDHYTPTVVVTETPPIGTGGGTTGGVTVAALTTMELF